MKKLTAAALSLSVLLAPVQLPAQTVKVQAPAGALSSGLGTVGGAPSIQMSDFSLAGPLKTGVPLAPALASLVAPTPSVLPLHAAAIQPGTFTQPVDAAVARKGGPQPIVIRALNAVKKTVGSLFSRNTTVPSKDAIGDGGHFFDGARKFLAMAALGTALVLTGCSKTDDPKPYTGSGHMDERPATATEVTIMLNHTLDASEAYAAHVAYNTWDSEYHLGVPHRNDFDFYSSHYANPLEKLSFDSAAAKLSTLRVDQAVGSKLMYADGAWTLIAEDYPSEYWVSKWVTVENLTNAQDAQDHLNRWVDASEAYDAKIAGDENGAVRLTYPEQPLTLAYNVYWERTSFNTFLEAMLWSLDNLDASQNRGAKIFFSPYDVAYIVIYPVDTGNMSSKLGVSKSALDSAVAANSTSTPLAKDPAGRAQRTLVNWKGVFAGVKKTAP